MAHKPSSTTDRYGVGATLWSVLSAETRQEAAEQLRFEVLNSECPERAAAAREALRTIGVPVPKPLPTTEVSRLTKIAGDQSLPLVERLQAVIDLWRGGRRGAVRRVGGAVVTATASESALAVVQTALLDKWRLGWPRRRVLRRRLENIAGDQHQSAAVRAAAAGCLESF